MFTKIQLHQIREINPNNIVIYWCDLFPNDITLGFKHGDSNYQLVTQKNEKRLFRSFDAAVKVAQEFTHNITITTVTKDGVKNKEVK